jgi:hypothetical protein
MSHENVERYRRSVHTWNRGALDEWHSHCGVMSSSVEVALKWAHVVTYYGGQQQIPHYPCWEEALEAVGLSEQPPA